MTKEIGEEKAKTTDGMGPSAVMSELASLIAENKPQSTINDMKEIEENNNVIKNMNVDDSVDHVTADVSKIALDVSFFSQQKKNII